MFILFLHPTSSSHFFIPVYSFIPFLQPIPIPISFSCIYPQFIPFLHYPIPLSGHTPPQEPVSQCSPCFLYSPRTQCCPAYAAACLCASPCVSMSPRVTPRYPITPCHRVPSCHHIPPCHSIPQQSPPVPTCPCCPRLSGGGGISAGQRSTQDHPPPREARGLFRVVQLHLLPLLSALCYRLLSQTSPPPSRTGKAPEWMALQSLL